MLMLQKIAEEKGYTQAWLGRRIGTSRQTIDAIYRTGKVPSYGLIMKLVDVLQVAPDNLVDADGRWRHVEE